MRRFIFAAGACFALTGCIIEQPQSPDWGRPKSQGYYPSPYAQGGYAPAPQAPYAPPPAYSAQPQQPAYAPQPPPPAYSAQQPPPAYLAQPQQPAYASQQPPPAYAAQPPPPAYAEQPEQAAYAPPSGDLLSSPPSDGSDTPGVLAGEQPHEPRNPNATFADEAIDYGVPPTNTIRENDFDAPTPTHVQGARTITTLALQSMLSSDRPPLLLDVIRGAQTVSLPNAVWLRDAGTGRHLDDDIQAWLDMQLSNLTGRDKTRPLVIFCASRMCWLAYNATLRAVDLGYTDVYWYRGGRDSWQAAGLPMAPVAPPPS